MTEKLANPISEAVIANFHAFEQSLGADTVAIHHHTRKEALNHFLRLGVPTTKNEEWRYTNIAPSLKGKFDFAKTSKSSNLDPEFLTSTLFEGIEANIIVLVNGKYLPYSSTVLSPIHEVEILALDRAIEKRSAILDTYYTKVAPYNNNALNALNTAFAEQGAFIYVPEGKEVELPIFIHHIADGTSDSTICHPRNLIVLGKNAKVTIVETYSSLGENSVFTNALSEVVVSEGAHLEYVKMQAEKGNATQVNFTQINHAGNSTSNTTTITVGGKLVRNNLHIAVDGEFAEANLNGLYWLNADRLVDNHTLVDHIQPNSQSNELYKGIVSDKGTAVFNGKIFVKAEAQKTNAFQSNRNILLSPDGTVNTKPQLEIFADDVRCTHGCTTGAMDNEPMFYLRSRGLDENTARAMLLHAFAQEVVEKINHDSIKQFIARQIDSLLGFENE